MERGLLSIYKVKMKSPSLLFCDENYQRAEKHRGKSHYCLCGVLDHTLHGQSLYNGSPRLHACLMKFNVFGDFLGEMW